MKSQVSCFKSVGIEQVRQTRKHVCVHQVSDSRMNQAAHREKN